MSRNKQISLMDVLFKTQNKISSFFSAVDVTRHISCEPCTGPVNGGFDSVNKQVIRIHELHGVYKFLQLTQGCQRYVFYMTLVFIFRKMLYFVISAFECFNPCLMIFKIISLVNFTFDFVR